MNDETKNLITFGVIAAILFIAYQTFIVAPAARQARLAHGEAAAASGSGAAAPVVAQRPTLSRPAALAISPRVTIDTPSLSGSIDLRGARFDDLFLKNYHDEVSPNSPRVELLRPEGMADAYFAEVGWVGANLSGLPGPQSQWTLTSGSVLSPGHPVVLTFAAPGGLTFTRQIAVDDKFMFTITDTVANGAGAPVAVAPYVSVQRQGLPPGLTKVNNVHQGAIGVLGVPEQDLAPGLAKRDVQQLGYKNWKKKGEREWRSRGGWLGITDKYWMTAFAPEQNLMIDARARVTADPSSDVEIYETTYSGQAQTIAPGATITETTHMFSGAKIVPVLNAYGKALNIPLFNDAVDWGWFWVLTKPIFALLEFFHKLVGNFGVAILLLTVVVRVVTFPLANRGYEMGIKMKKVQPELKLIQARLKDDPPALQKEMMALYQREKVNPVSGCIPALLPIPLFIALTNIFTVTIEMRHAPFFGWIHDLSARDPTTLFNLFGLIPWDPSAAPLIGGILGGMLHVGVWPLAYGLSIWVSQSMTPMTGVDPTQQALMKFMPIIFTFIMAQYAVGLLIYWTWSSVITILQQYIMMRRFKVENPIDDLLRRLTAKPEAG